MVKIVSLQKNVDFFQEWECENLHLKKKKEIYIPIKIGLRGNPDN